jgi:hypothetical protein
MKRAVPIRAAAYSCLAAVVCLLSLGAFAQPPAKRPDAKFPKHETRTLRGRVVWQAEALSRRFGIRSVPEAAERSLVLETPTGELHPLVEDSRGRAFRADERLRGIDLELVVRQYEGSPLVQVIQVYSLKKSGKYEVDYWCDICSIAMYELKPCDCCQGPIELRERLVERK